MVGDLPNIQVSLMQEIEGLQLEIVNLKSRIMDYEKQWNDMHLTICKFVQENLELKKALGEKALANIE